MRSFLDVPVAMRDGVMLSTDIRHPDGAGPFPTIVYRTPYNNCNPGGALKYVELGYALVTQDCRGRFDSGGTFDPFCEANDGFDTLAWIRAQPWCDGRLGMIGGSYLGSTQLAAAWMRPPGLRAIVPRVMGRDAFRDMLYHNGVLDLGIAGVWGFGMAGRSGQAGAIPDWAQLARHLPLCTMDQAAGYRLPYFQDWLAHPTYDDFWKRLSVEQHYADFDVPMLHLGGWYDLYAEGQLHNFASIRRLGGPRARAHQRIVFGPWAHGLNTRTLGPLDFGPDAVTGIDALETRWLDHFVRDVANGVEREPPVRLFIMGTNVWRDEPEWPLARAQERAFYLASGGRANSLFGDGALVAAPPTGAATDGYAYNPDYPVPTLGGNVLGGNAGPNDHAPIERRDDVLVYTSDVLTAPLEVTGLVNAVLHVASDAPDTDFIARLCDVYPDGRSLIICDGNLRMRLREGLDREVLMTPGQVYEVTVAMGATANVFLPGHRVRLEITSSCFPRLARNLNTGEPIATGTRLAVAQQTVHHSRARPSRLLLPVVPAP